MKIAVHLHVFYLDLLPFLKEALNNIPCNFDLLVSIPEIILYDENNVREILSGILNVQQIIVEKVPNRGRDVAPMLCTFREKLMCYDVFLHLHTKKSPHNKSLNGWLPFICRHLLNERHTSSILELLAGDAGMIAPPNYTYDPSIDGWGKGNKKIAQSIINRSTLKINLEKECPAIDYPQGSMFWTKTSFLKPLFDISFTYNDFPEEPIGVDGTIAHALERLFFIWGDDGVNKIYKVYLSEEEYKYQKRIEVLFEDLVKTHLKNEKHLKAIRLLTYLACAMGITIMVLLFFI